MDRKIIFLDIDGTLTLPGCNTPPASALKAVRGAQKKGHLVYLCTGRNLNMLSPLLQYGFDGVIASSGAYILCGDKVIYDCPMTPEEAQRITEVSKQTGIFRTVECLDGSYTDEGFKLFLEEHAEEGGNSELLRWRKQIESELNIQPMAAYRGQPIYKFVVMSPTTEQIGKAREALGDEFQFCIQDSNSYGITNGEILKKEYDKGVGIERVCAETRIPISETVGFGDSMNDLEMLEKAGLAICMANGSERLKKLADEICPSVEEDGLYTAFEKFHLL